MWEKVRNYIDKHPVIFHIVFLLLYCGIYIFYHGAVQPDSNYEWDISFLRLAIVFATILFIKDAYHDKFDLGLTWKNSKKSLLLLWPIILFGVFNFLMSFSVLTSGLHIVWYSFIMVVFQYAVTGIYEEVGIRGVLVTHMMRVNKDKKNCILYAVLMSSFLFGIVHINNIIRTGPNAIIQCIYAFAIGLVFAAAYVRTRNICVAIVLHAIFDIVGSLIQLFLAPGAVVPDYPKYGIEVLLNSVGGSLLMFAIMSIISIVAGLYMIRKSKRPEIMELWKDQFED